MPGTVSDSSNDSIGFFLSKISKKKVSVFFFNWSIWLSDKKWKFETFVKHWGVCLKDENFLI